MAENITKRFVSLRDCGFTLQTFTESSFCYVEGKGLFTNKSVVHGRRIDQFVYELYELTLDKMAIVERSDR